MTEGPNTEGNKYIFEGTYLIITKQDHVLGKQ